MPRKLQTNSAKPSLVFPDEPAVVIENEETVSTPIVDAVAKTTVTETKVAFDPFEMFHSVPGQDFMIHIGKPNHEAQSIVWFERDNQKFVIGSIYVVDHMQAQEITQTAKRFAKETLLRWGTII
jgi:hypothetical protein